MTKGALIKGHIANGMTNEEILFALAAVGKPTTMNSVRWYRSKVAKKVVKAIQTHTAKPQQTGLVSGRNLVDVVVELGLERHVQECLVRLTTGTAAIEHIWNVMKTWTFHVNHNVTTRSGQCRYRRREIEVHGLLLDRPEHLKQTLLHELAHLLDPLVNNNTYNKHGQPWKFIMSYGFRIPANRTCGEEVSNLLRAKKVEKRGPAKNHWECTRCGHVEPIRGKRKYRPEQYTHKGCGGNFKTKEV